jgi:hypothetical protein
MKHPKSGGPPVNVELTTVTPIVKYVVLLTLLFTKKSTVPLPIPADPL